MRRRKLSLQREVLTEIEPDELREVAAADPPETTGPTTGATRFSCLTFISCFPGDCAHTRNCA